MPGDTAYPHISIRLRQGDEIAMGPGKADLLEAIARTGSISAAGRSMNMSYRRAWLLVETMNACFSEPLVETSRGGSGGGGACVTPTGEAVLAHYRAMQRAAEAAIVDHAAAIRLTMRHPPT